MIKRVFNNFSVLVSNYIKEDQEPQKLQKFFLNFFFFKLNVRKSKREKREREGKVKWVR
jgi:hypothetical protein